MISHDCASRWTWHRNEWGAVCLTSRIARDKSNRGGSAPSGTSGLAETVHGHVGVSGHEEEEGNKKEACADVSHDDVLIFGRGRCTLVRMGEKTSGVFCVDLHQLERGCLYEQRTVP